MESIYLDHNATTPVDSEVAEAMRPYFCENFGNSSSVHQFGRDAKVSLETAREKIAAFINCEPSELFFTSGGTESDNIAVLGTAFQWQTKKNHVIVGSSEHHAVLEPAEWLHHKHGFAFDKLSVDREGRVSANTLKWLITDQTSLVSVMHANNETGTIQELNELTSVCREKNILFHTDAVQSIGKIPVDVKKLGVDMLSLTGHKIYGPKGAGALFIRQGIKISPLFYGGSHEKKRRPGTENIACIVGLAKALEIAGKKMEDDAQRLGSLADYFIDTVASRIPHTSINSPRNNRIPQTINLSFAGAEGESIVLSLDMEGIAVSSGSACTSGATEPSHVLVAMGIDRIVAQGAVRFSLGRSTTKDQIERVLNVLPSIIERLRAMSPVSPQSRA